MEQRISLLIATMLCICYAVLAANCSMFISISPESGNLQDGSAFAELVKGERIHESLAEKVYEEVSSPAEVVLPDTVESPREQEPSEPPPKEEAADVCRTMPQLLVENDHIIDDITLDTNGDLYYALNGAGPDKVSWAIMVLKKGHEAPTLLYSEPNEQVRALHIDKDHLYWFSDTHLKKASKSGGANIQILVSMENETQRSLMGMLCKIHTPFLYPCLVSDSEYLYWSNRSPSCPSYMRIKKDGTGLQNIFPQRMGGPNAGLVLDGDDLYLGLLRMSKDGKNRKVLAQYGVSGGWTMDQVNIYWQDSYGINRTQKDGSFSERLYKKPTCRTPSQALLEDGNDLYWFDHCSNELKRIQKDGKNMKVIIKVSKHTQSLFKDKDAIYWSVRNKNGGIYKLLWRCIK